MPRCLEPLVFHFARMLVLTLPSVIYVKTWGTTVDKLSAAEFAFESSSGIEEDGSGNLSVKDSYAPILKKLQQGLDIRTNWQVGTLLSRKLCLFRCVLMIPRFLIRCVR